MGRRGPAPQPTAMKLAKGETRPSRTNPAEPKLAPPVSLEPPKRLTGAGQAAWLKHAQPLTDAGVLTDHDLDALESYCSTLTAIERFETEARSMGPTMAIRCGVQGMVLRLQTLANQLRVQLGLTPSSRTQVRATKVMSTADRKMRERFFGPR